MAYIRPVVRFRVTITSVWSGILPLALIDGPEKPEQPAKGKELQTVIETDAEAVLLVDGKEVWSGASGLLYGEVSESIESGLQATLVFQVADAIYWVRSQDHVEIEASTADDSSRFRTIFTGFVSDTILSGNGTPEGVNTSRTIIAHGVEKLFRQAVYNWQSIYTGGDIRIMKDWVDGDPVDTYQKFMEQASGMAPQKVIQVLLNMGFKWGVSLSVGGVLVRPGQWFKFGEGANWENWWGTTPTLACGVLYENWNGTLWELIQRLAEPQVHELFFKLSNGVPTLIHRPIPFPGTETTRWENLASRRFLLGKPGLYTAMSWNFRQSDSKRANIFHWGWGSHLSAGGNAFGSKLAFGYQMEKRFLGRYGVSAVTVTTNLIPTVDEKTGKVLYERQIQQCLAHVAKRDCIQHLLWDGTITLPCIASELEIGTVIEDWSMGQPFTGYCTGRVFSFSVDNDSIQVNTTLNLERGYFCDADSYLEKVKALSSPISGSYMGPTGIKDTPMGKALRNITADAEDQTPSKPVRPGPPGAIAAPLTIGRKVVSPFGPRPHMDGPGSRNHAGIDLYAPLGTQVKAPIAGTVTAIDSTGAGGYGKFVKILGSDGTEHILAHLSSVSVTQGQAVSLGALLGLSGNTGTVNGANGGYHLHWQVNQNGKPVDPLAWMGGRLL